MNSCVGHFNVSLTVRAKSLDSVHELQCLQGKQSRSGLEPASVPLHAYRLTAGLNRLAVEMLEGRQETWPKWTRTDIRPLNSLCKGMMKEVNTGALRPQKPLRLIRDGKVGGGEGGENFISNTYSLHCHH